MWYVCILNQWVDAFKLTSQLYQLIFHICSCSDHRPCSIIYSLNNWNHQTVRSNKTRKNSRVVYEDNSFSFFPWPFQKSKFRQICGSGVVKIDLSSGLNGKIRWAESFSSNAKKHGLPRLKPTKKQCKHIDDWCAIINVKCMFFISQWLVYEWKTIVGITEYFRFDK